MNEKVAVLYGGTSSEREISLMSGRNILNSLLELNINAFLIDTRDYPITQLKQQKFKKAFIALHGQNGENGITQGVLEYLKIPYTGSNVTSTALSIDKLKTKLLWKACGLPIGSYCYLTYEYFINKKNNKIKEKIKILGLPLIIKPNNQGSSIGISIIYDYTELNNALRTAFYYDEIVLIEKFIYGKEYSLAILEDNVLPSILIAHDRKFYDYEAKYQSNMTQYFCPSRLKIDEEIELKKIIKKAWNTLGCKHWGRIDVIIDPKKKCWLLEVNTCPGMSNNSLMPLAAKSAGISFKELVFRILTMV